MAQTPFSKMSRQVRRAHERSMIRKTMTKTERRFYARLPRNVRRDIYHTTLQMIAEGQIQVKE